MAAGDFSPEVLDKAKRLLDRDGVRRDEDHPNSIFWIRSASSEKLYRVQSDWNPGEQTLTWITCTCPHGLNAGAGTTRCYHAAAVLMLLKEESGVEPTSDEAATDAEAERIERGLR